MPTHYTNCLYIHGLHSDINPEKKKILDKIFPKVTARHLDYANEPNTYNMLKEMCLNEEVDIIIGSSFGGYLGFYLSRELQLPTILFNPAMFFRYQDAEFVPKDILSPSPFAKFIIGENDTVIPPFTTEKFISSNEVEDNIITVKCNWLEHRIDLATFEAMINSGIILADNLTNTSH